MFICSKRNLWRFARQTTFLLPHTRRLVLKALIRCCKELELRKFFPEIFFLDSVTFNLQPTCAWPHGKSRRCWDRKPSRKITGADPVEISARARSFRNPKKHQRNPLEVQHRSVRIFSIRGWQIGSGWSRCPHSHLRLCILSRHHQAPRIPVSGFENHKIIYLTLNRHSQHI